MKVKVAIVEDNPKTLEYLSALFSGSDGIALVGAFPTGQEALDALQPCESNWIVSRNISPKISSITTVRREDPSVRPRFAPICR